MVSMDRILVPFLSDELRSEHLYKSFISIPVTLSVRNSLNVEIGYFSDSKLIDSNLVLNRIGGANRCGLRNFLALLFVIRRARKTKILFLTHIANYNTLLALAFRICNPRGKIMLKLDMDLQFFNYKPSILSKISIRFLTRISDVISYESVKVGIKIKSGGILGAQVSETKLFHIPNCPSPRDVKLTNAKLPSKDKLIVTVGRLSSYQKNVELIIKALDGLELGDWRFIFIGSSGEHIKSEIKRLKLQGQNVSYAGEISNRSELYEIYSKASYLVLSSRYEGFATVLVEASHRGCQVISTDVNGIEEVTNFGTFGYRYSGVNELREILSNVVSEQVNPKTAYKVQKFARNELSWQSVIENCGVEKVLL
jgi:glycosyltransferase involved in cell wall biosynthesis